MQLRTVKALLYAEEMDMGGMPIRQPLPTGRVDQVDPFLLLHHHIGKVSAGIDPRNAGVGPHPHRGFSPVTFIFQGNVHHRDSRGNSAVVNAGGIQWMDAGMGIIHSERPSQELADNGGVQEIVQLWINTPGERKMDQPNYQSLQKEDIPVFFPTTGKGSVQVVAGSINGIKGPANSKLDLLLLRADLEAGARLDVPMPDAFNATIYVVKGKIALENYGPVEELYLAVFEQNGAGLRFTATGDAIVLVLAGKPLNEPVAQYGPFVMTNQTEILRAMRDYQMGKMGVLIEEFN